jgi:MSHA biogenesis protein MshK
MNYRAGAFLVGLAAFAMPVHAQALKDPTLPPNVAAAAGADAVVSSGPVLQSVLISTERRSAVIDGRQVGLGGKFGALRLVRITESEVTLEGADGWKTLKLFPEVRKSDAGATSQSPETKVEAVPK